MNFEEEYDTNDDSPPKLLLVLILCACGKWELRVGCWVIQDDTLVATGKNEGQL